MSAPVELHCHSTCSDGTLAPAELVARAKRAGVSALVLTDHDTVSGVEEARAAGLRCGVRIAAGIEINTAEGSNVHVLGYGIDPLSEFLASRLTEFRRRRRSRARLIVARLNDLGIDLDYEEVSGDAGDGDSIGRPHIADALKRRKIVRSRAEAFERFLAPGKPAFVDAMGPSVADAIEAIREAGGWSCLAHPGTVDPAVDIGPWVEAGLGGLEAYYGSHTAPQVQRHLETAKRYGILAAGGSDFHGPQTGRGNIGKHRLPPEVFSALEPSLRFDP